MGDLHKVKEDQSTFMKFYKMKKDFLPNQTNVYTYKTDSFVKWRPSARECSVMSYITTTAGYHKFYVFSGLSNIALNDIVELYVNEEDGTTKWYKAKNVKMDSDTNFGRYGSTQITFEEKSDKDSNKLEKVVFYYGGGKMFNPLTSLRECLNQIIKFTPSTGEFKSVKQSGIVHPARRYHSSCSFGNYMIIHGGIDELGRILSDVICFDLKSNSWVEVEVVKESLNKWITNYPIKIFDYKDDYGPGGLFYHKCTPIFYKQRYGFWKEYLYECKLDELDSDYEVEDPLVKLPEIEWGQIENYIQQEGIYFFGGKRSDGYISEDLWCLKICDKIKIKVAMKAEKRKQNKFSTTDVVESFHDKQVYAYFQWKKIKTDGQPPCKRYAHCCHFYEEKNLLIVYGGRSDTKENPILNDINMLRMDSFTWIKVKYEGSNLGAKANFASIFCHSKLIIFGGIRDNLWPCNDTCVVEFNSSKIEQLLVKDKEDEEERLRKEMQESQE